MSILYARIGSLELNAFLYIFIACLMAETVGGTTSARHSLSCATLHLNSTGVFLVFLASAQHCYILRMRALANAVSIGAPSSVLKHPPVILRHAYGLVLAVATSRSTAYLAPLIGMTLTGHLTVSELGLLSFLDGIFISFIILLYY